MSDTNPFNPDDPFGDTYVDELPDAWIPPADGLSDDQRVAKIEADLSRMLRRARRARAEADRRSAVFDAEIERISDLRTSAVVGPQNQADACVAEATRMLAALRRIDPTLRTVRTPYGTARITVQVTPRAVEITDEPSLIDWLSKHQPDVLKIEARRGEIRWTPGKMLGPPVGDDEQAVWSLLGSDGDPIPGIVGISRTTMKATPTE
jgi:hypothetical protein